MPVALITGCSRGIGLEAALRLRREGWAVVATLRDTRPGAPGVAALTRAGAELVALDVTEGEQVRAVIGAAAARYGGLDALVANAGYGIFGAFEDLDPEAVRGVFETNVFGAMDCARAALPHLRARRGRLVLISSVAGRRAAPCSTVYNASKFAIEGFGEGLRHELAPFGVPVVLIQPGSTRTGFEGARRIRSGAFSGPYGRIEERVRQLQLEGAEAADEAAIVAEAIWRALSARRPPLRIATGRRTRLQLTLIRLLPGRAWEALVRRTLALPEP